MNLHEDLNKSGRVIFEGEPVNPKLVPEILWRLDNFKIHQQRNIYESIIHPFIKNYPKKTFDILNKPRDGWPAKINVSYQSWCINSLLINELKHAVHSLPLNKVYTAAISRFDNTYYYSYSSFLSWKGQWTKNKIWLSKLGSFYVLIQDWILINKTFPFLNVTVQYCCATSYDNNEDPILTIHLKNGKVTWNRSEPELRKGIYAYSCMRKPKIELIAESFKNVCEKFKNTNTPRIQSAITKRNRTLVTIKRNQQKSNQ
jgi:hypothetical protein